MGNWRTVRIVGTCTAAELEQLRRAIRVDAQYSNFGPLSNTAGLAGLGEWPAETIDCVGNLAERDYAVYAVAGHLRELAEAAPSLSLKVHCGDDWEERKCIATITVAQGEISIGEPEISDVGEQDPGVLARRVRLALFGLPPVKTGESQKETLV